MLTVITGPMFGGKTSKMFEILDEYRQTGRVSALFKPKNDDRYDDRHVCTHDGRKRWAYPIPKDKPEELLTLAGTLALLKPDAKEGFKPPSVFGIDEPQFFDSEGLIAVVEDMLYGRGFPQQPHIVVSGLSQDSSGKPFGAMPHLLAIADDIIHCKAVCAVTKVRKAGTRTYRKDKSNKNQIAVGGVEMYEPRSFETWLEAQ
jgi:thymidine kinase